LWFVRGREEVHTGIWWGETREGVNLEEPGVDWKIIFNWIFKKRVGSIE
jgi:hypothetical protein